MARILVIDDDPYLRTMLRHMLEYEGYEVLEADDGEEGVRVFRAERPDLIITDILMPRQEGLETIISLRREQSDVPIIAMSGGGRGGVASYLATADKLGAKRTLYKPFSRQDLLDAVVDVLAPHGDGAG